MNDDVHSKAREKAKTFSHEHSYDEIADEFIELLK
jgi:hypothetical protein